MPIYLSALFFLAGVVLVVKGGDWFVDAASWIAKAAKIPPFIIGATIVSIATTMPEMIVSVMASAEGKNDMAVGNAIGSVTVNTGLIMAIAIVFMTVTASRKKYFKQFAILIAAAVVLWLGSLNGSVQLWTSIVLILMFAVFMAFNVRDAKKEPAISAPVEINKKTITKNVILFLIGAAGIVIGSNLLIRGGSDIAIALGVPERVIAVTMVALGTSLPELVTTLTAIKKKESQISIGNIVGANIIDLALILPICSFVSGGGFTVSEQCIRLDFPACILVTLAAIVPMIIKERAYKVQGIIMFAMYCVYIVLTV